MQPAEGPDPLDEIGDLVGHTLNILGNASDPYESAQTSAPSGTAPQTADGINKQNSSSKPWSTGLDEVDILGGDDGERAQPSGELGPLATAPTATFYDEELEGPHTATSAGLTNMDMLQGAPLYEDLDRAPSDPPPPPAPEVQPEATALLPPRAPATTDPTDGIKVTIKEPEKVETVSSIGIKSHYVQYLVRTDSTIPGLLADGLEVKRRFSDFDTLHKHLKQEYRGYIVPPLPEKSFIQGKMAQDDFIRLRRADLQAFVKCLTAHPVLRLCEALKIFLLHPGELTRNPAWTYLVNPPASLKAQRAGSTSTSYTSLDLDASSAGGSSSAATFKAGLGSWVNWMKASVAQFVPPKRELSEEEVMLRQHKELMQDLEKLLELAVESARALCAHQEAVCADVRELGRTFAMLSRFEEAVQAKVGQYTPQGASAANRATDLNTMAYGSIKQHAVWKTLSIKTAASLVTLHDYFVLVPEAIAALDLREQALTHLHVLQDELAAKQHAQEQANVQANKLRILSGATAAPSPAEKRSYQLTTAIAQLEEQIKAAQEAYDTLKQRNQSELTRLGLEREVDFRKMMAHFTQTQAELIRASADMWANLAKQYEPAPAAS